MGTIGKGMGNGIGRPPSTPLFNNAPELRLDNARPLAGSHGHRQA